MPTTHTRILLNPMLTVCKFSEQVLRERFARDLVVGAGNVHRG